MDYWGWFTSNGNSFSAIAALLACAVAFVTLIAQRQHNRLSVRPLAQVDFRDGESRLLVKLVNNGTGPLIVDSLSVWESGERIGDALIDALPEVEGLFEDFVANIDGRSIPAGGAIVLLDFIPEGESAAMDRFALRKALARLEIRLTYRDIYNGLNPVYSRDLRWFGRMLDT